MSVIATLRDLPQVEVLARALDGIAPSQVTRAEARVVIDQARELVAGGGSTSFDRLVANLATNLATRQPMRRVINATGVLLHTNLGRAPMAALDPEIDGLRAVPIELTLGDGRRGRRLGALEADLAELTGADDALVVNNNAAALLLVLSMLTSGDRNEVVVSRGQLVEIGGSFRVPEIVAQGGARLREVGTTNRTHLSDFAEAIGPATAAILEVHPSNFAQVGFTATVPTDRLAELARANGLVMVHDVGSGLVDARTPWLRDGPPAWLATEPAARQILDAGAHLVTFSGDKLLGGPQAGIICGEADLVERVRRHPLARALRYDKVRAAHLHATVRAHQNRSASSVVPFWRMAVEPEHAVRDRAETLAAALQPALTALGWRAESMAVTDTIGSGSAPAQGLPGWGVALTSASGSSSALSLLATALRGAGSTMMGDDGAQPLSVIATVRDDRLVLSLRTVEPADDAALVATVLAAVGAVGGVGASGSPGSDVSGPDVSGPDVSGPGSHR